MGSGSKIDNPCEDKIHREALFWIAELQALDVLTMKDHMVKLHPAFKKTVEEVSKQKRSWRSAEDLAKCSLRVYLKDKRYPLTMDEIKALGSALSGYLVMKRQTL